VTLVEFWNPSRWGDLWHVVRYIMVGGVRVRSVHSGHDIKAREHADIPTLAGGTVTLVGRRADIGHYLEVRVNANRYDTYCHILPNVTSGQTITTGEVRSKVAGPNDDHGTMWTGPHLHFMTAERSGAYANRSITTDPRPHIEAALSGTAGLNYDPLEDDMKPRLLPITEAVGNPPTPGAAIWFDGPSGVRHVETLEDLSLLSRYIATWSGSSDAMYSTEVDRIAYYTNPLPVDVAPGPVVPFSVDDIRAAVGDELADDFAALRSEVNRPRTIS